MKSIHDIDHLVQSISEIYQKTPKRRIELGTLTPSAVLLPLFEKNSEPHLLFTKRTETVRTHKGQIAFPGGAWDISDLGLMETALREAEEEIGLSKSNVKVIAELNDRVTPTLFHITPFVGIFSYPAVFTINEHEIAELIEIPLRELMDDKRHRLGYRDFQNKTYEIHYYDYDGNTVWGVTGIILHEFIEQIRIATSV